MAAKTDELALKTHGYKHQTMALEKCGCKNRWPGSRNRWLQTHERWLGTDGARQDMFLMDYQKRCSPSKNGLMAFTHVCSPRRRHWWIKKVARAMNCASDAQAYNMSRARSSEEIDGPSFTFHSLFRKSLKAWPSTTTRNTRVRNVCLRMRVHTGCVCANQMCRADLQSRSVVCADQMCKVYVRCREVQVCRSYVCAGHMCVQIICVCRSMYLDVGAKTYELLARYR